MNGLFAVALCWWGDATVAESLLILEHLYGKIIDADGKGIAEASVLLLVTNGFSLKKNNTYTEGHDYQKQRGVQPERITHNGN